MKSLDTFLKNVSHGLVAYVATIIPLLTWTNVSADKSVLVAAIPGAAGVLWAAARETDPKVTALEPVFAELKTVEQELPAEVKTRLATIEAKVDHLLHTTPAKKVAAPVAAKTATVKATPAK